MTSEDRLLSGRLSVRAMAAFGLVVIAFSCLTPTAARAQYVENTLYNFMGGSTGGGPASSLVLDSHGNLYGTTPFSGSNPSGCSGDGCGVVYEVSPPSGGSGPWTETVPYGFTGGSDGGIPEAAVILDAQDNLYGTTDAYGSFPSQNCCGVVFELTPPPSGSGPRTETVLYAFCPGGGSCSDGDAANAIIFDSAGNLYGTTGAGGSEGSGVVFELSPPSSGTGPWTEKVLYNFCSAPGCSDGSLPFSHNLIFDANGNLYGTTNLGGDSGCNQGNGCGVVFELSPPSGGSGPWTETVLYSFTGGSDGGLLWAGLVLDSHGNLYGAANYGGNTTAAECGASGNSLAGCGVVFELSPPSSGTGPWTEAVLHAFCSAANCADGAYPNAFAALIFDSKGNLYGTTAGGGMDGQGVVFELSPPSGGGAPWAETILHTFSGTDGTNPDGGVIFDSKGNLYGAAFSGGDHSCSVPYTCGVIFELSPLATTTVLTASPNPSTGGQTVTFTATVTANSGATPTGTVTFYNGATEIGIVGFNSPGVAVLTDAALLPGTHSITAAYNGSSTLPPSTSPAVTQVVNAEPTITTLVDNGPNPSALGQTVAFTATVSSSNGVTPIGTVSFKNGSVLLGNVNLTSAGVGTATATLNTASLPVGANSVTGAYTGSSNMSGSTSSAVSQVVNKATTTTVLTSSPNPSSGGQTVAFTATVTASAGGNPTGTVTFYNGSTTIGTVSFGTPGVAMLNYSALAAGTHSMTATYNGSTTMLGSTSPAISQVVNVATTTTALTASPNPSSGGQTVTFTATVSASGGAIATGTVTFYNGSASIGTIGLNGSGIAALKYSALLPGTHSITATYNGSSQMSGSSSPTLTQTVTSEPTTTVLTSSPNPSTFGQTVTFTATVTAGNGVTPAGAVVFKNGSTSIGTVSLTGGKAVLNYSALSVGTHSITSNYTGSSTMTASTSNTVSQLVNMVPTSTTLVSSLNPSGGGQVVTFTATVTASTGVIPTGNVTFFSDGTGIGTGNLNGSGVATLQYSQLVPGTHSIVATYNGSATLAASTSTPLSQVVNAATTTTSLTSNVNPSVYGNPVTFTATVTASDQVTPTGAVSFYNASTLLGTSNLSAGVATLRYALIPASTSQGGTGSPTITATYAGSSYMTGSTSPAYSQTVQQAGVSVTAYSAPNPSSVGEYVNFYFHATAPNSPLTPTGDACLLLYYGGLLWSQPLGSNGSAVVYVDGSNFPSSGTYLFFYGYENIDGNFEGLNCTGPIGTAFSQSVQ